MRSHGRRSGPHRDQVFRVFQVCERGFLPFRSEHRLWEPGVEVCRHGQHAPWSLAVTSFFENGRADHVAAGLADTGRQVDGDRVLAAAIAHQESAIGEDLGDTA